VWQGLGYYTRARNLQKGAKHVVKVYDGKLPETYKELMNIPGIGPYSAGAIASFAFKQAVPAIDGNVYRVMSRIYGVFASPFTSQGKKDFFRLVEELMDPVQPDVFNQALLDFGALQCTPKGPKCNPCPFADYCYALRNNLINSLPIKAKKYVSRDRFFTYILVRYRKSTFISKRKANDIWLSLYEFPLIESESRLDIDSIPQNPEWRKFFKGVRNVNVMNISNEVKHVLSHQNLYTRFVTVEVDKIPRNLQDEYLLVDIDDLHNYSTPVLIDSYLAAEPAAKYFLNNTDDSST